MASWSRAATSAWRVSGLRHARAGACLSPRGAQPRAERTGSTHTGPHPRTPIFGPALPLLAVPIEKVFLAQKLMVRKANLAGKPVITATQMLESMIVNARPTRAECSDVANAVLDGTDSVMLSGETANGAHPLSALSYMSRTCVEAEGVLNHNSLFVAIRESTLRESGTVSTSEAVASSAVKTAVDTGAKAIIVCSETGNTARLVAKYRSAVPVLVLTSTEVVARQVAGMLRGCRAVVVGSMIGTESILLRAVEQCSEWGWCAPGDSIVAVHGMLEGRPGATNVCRVLTVASAVGGGGGGAQ